jgi:DNA replication protein DnaC
MDSDVYEKRLAHLTACNVPELEAQFAAKGVPDGPMVQAVRDYAAGPLTFCLLLGKAGSGKTVAAAEALLNARLAWDGGKSWCYSSAEARFVLATELARLSYFEAASVKRLGRLERIPWLVLDDLGGELFTEGWKSNLTEIVLQRNSGRRKTLITSNLGVDEFKARYDDRIISRIRGNGVVIISGNTDLRRAST